MSIQITHCLILMTNANGKIHFAKHMQLMDLHHVLSAHSHSQLLLKSGRILLSIVPSFALNSTQNKQLWCVQLVQITAVDA